MRQLIVLIFAFTTIASCTSFDHYLKPNSEEVNVQSNENLKSSQFKSKNKNETKTATAQVDSKDNKTNSTKTPVKKLRPLSKEQQLEKIDRQAGHPDSNDSPKSDYSNIDTTDFVFSPLFNDVKPLPVTPLMLTDSTNDNVNIDQLLPKQSKPKDFSDYGFYTPTSDQETLAKETLIESSVKKQTTVDLVEVIRSNFQLDLSIDNKRIRNQLNWYVRNPSYLDRTFRRASRYIYHVVEKIKEHNLPMELALLPFVESAYDPFAYSHGRASGLWQFIPGTGKIYGLHQNWWYDGRRDVIASTQAAMEYLSYLGKRFDGNWLHALAAYNSGSGRVSGAIRKNKKKNKPTDFWSLKLPRETRAYVPKLIALSKIVQDPKKYGISLPSIDNKPYFKIVKTGGQIDLAQAASLAEIDINEIYKLNPGFNQWASAPLGPHRLLVPFSKADSLEIHLNKLPPEKRLNWTRYTVLRGDSLIKIAKKFNTTPKLIKDVNNLSSNMIRQKQKLLIPVASRGKSYYDLSESNRLATKQNRLKGPKDASKLNYTVRAGDTLWDLSREHKVGLRSLAKWNGIAPTDPIKPGQNLLIWSKKKFIEAAPVASRPNFRTKRNMIKKIGYKVRRGDSLARIAQKFSVTIKDLVAWNNLNKQKYLQPGQKLTIYVDITNS